MDNGKQWPIGIITAILLIVVACVVTVYIALLAPVEENNDMMLDYHALDSNVNDILANSIIFNQTYTLAYVGQGVSMTGSDIAYRIVDKAGNPVNNAKFEVILTRPATLVDNITLGEPEVHEGTYRFASVKVPLEGRWNILAKITVGNHFRHMNLQSDTRDKAVYEYGLDKPMRNAGANAP